VQQSVDRYTNHGWLDWRRRRESLLRFQVKYLLSDFLIGMLQDRIGCFIFDTSICVSKLKQWFTPETGHCTVHITLESS
jgi:hypothetical protein